LERFHGVGEVAFALEGCTGWRYVVEELVRAGVTAHVAEPAETAALRGKKSRAKTDRADARHLRPLLVDGRVPDSWIPPAHVLDLRVLGPLLAVAIWEELGDCQRFTSSDAAVRHAGLDVTVWSSDGSGRRLTTPVPSGHPRGVQPSMICDQLPATLLLPALLDSRPRTSGRTTFVGTPRTPSCSRRHRRRAPR